MLRRTILLSRLEGDYASSEAFIQSLWETTLPRRLSFSPYGRLRFLGGFHSVPMGAVPFIRKLVLDRVSGSSTVILACPRLDALTIIRGDRSPMSLTILGEDDGDLSESLCSLTLERVQAFPGKWPRLRSLTVTDSRLELPRFPELMQLRLDRPYRTNGVMVANLAEYERAWRKDKQ